MKILTERTEGRIYQEKNGTLFISQVEEADPRKFLCFLKPKESTTATPISVAVNLEIHGMGVLCIRHLPHSLTGPFKFVLNCLPVPARIEPLQDVDPIRGSKFNLTCVVHGDSNGLQANWYHRVSRLHPWRIINQTCILPASYSDADSYSISVTAPDLANDPLACQKMTAGRFDGGIVFKQVS